MSSVAISYTTQDTSTVYNIVFTNFTDGTLPRSYVEQTNYTYGTKGTSIVNGPAYQEKRVWAISSLLPTATAEQVDIVYRQWDQDRAAGYSAALGLVDTTFGGTVTTNVIFTTAPTFERYGPNYFTVSFGLTEV